MTIHITDERPWCICISDDKGVRMSETHPVTARLGADERENVLRAGHGIASILGTDWHEDTSEYERRRWNSPWEMLLNAHAWNQIRQSFPEALGGDVADALEAANLPRSALRSLDAYDTVCLRNALADAALSAYRTGCDVVDAVQQKLIEWLQDWTEADTDDLAELVRLVRRMTCTDCDRCGVNWIGEGSDTLVHWARVVESGRWLAEIGRLDLGWSESCPIPVVSAPTSSSGPRRSNGLTAARSSFCTGRDLAKERAW
jgi:hypothetical protein